MSTFLGRGWAFPPDFSTGGAQVAMVEEEVDVHQSLAILFATRPGERVMQENFGCNLDEVMFEEIDHALIGRLGSLIRDAILAHETRVNLLAVDVSPDEQEVGLLQIRVDYSIVGTNSRFNMVYPFYLNEATFGGS